VILDSFKGNCQMGKFLQITFNTLTLKFLEDLEGQRPGKHGPVLTIKPDPRDLASESMRRSTTRTSLFGSFDVWE
jgi:hypothetical protein